MLRSTKWQPQFGVEMRLSSYIQPQSWLKRDTGIHSKGKDMIAVHCAGDVGNNTVFVYLLELFPIVLDVNFMATILPPVFGVQKRSPSSGQRN